MWYTAKEPDPDYVVALLGAVLDSRPGDYFWVWLLSEFKQHGRMRDVLQTCSHPVGKLVFELLNEAVA